MLAYDEMMVGIGEDAHPRVAQTPVVFWNRLFMTEEEKRLIFGVHNETENMKGVLVRRKPPRS